MPTNGLVGAVVALWRFPVKSVRGERLEEAEFTEHGLLGDRAYALIDVETGKVVSAKSARLFPGLFGCRAAFVEPPQPGGEAPPVRIELPDGTSVSSGSAEVDRVLSAYFRRDVTLARAAPEDYTIDQYHPDIEDVDPAGYQDTFVEQKLGSAFFTQIGLDSPVPVGSFLDLFPVSVLTTSTLKRLSELQPQSRFDQRRFRMNVVVGTEEGGFVENDWIDHELSIGEAVRLGVAMADPRCVMTTLAQEDLPKDTEVLRTLTRHNRVQVGAAGLFPCAGVYAVVASPGKVRVGERVALPVSGWIARRPPVRYGGTLRLRGCTNRRVGDVSRDSEEADQSRKEKQRAAIGLLANRGNGSPLRSRCTYVVSALIARRKDGLYMARYTVQTATGKKRKTLYGKTRGEVSEKLTKAMANRDGGLFFDADNLKVEEYMTRWLADSVRDTVRRSTFARYEQITRLHIVPAFGRTKLKNLSPAHVRGLYREKLDTGLSARTVQYVHATLHKALKQAVADGLIPRNVTEAVKAPRPVKKEIRPLNAEQARTLLDTAHGDRLEALYVVAVTAGMRQGELLGLKWEDLDLDAGKLAVRRSLSVTKDGPAFELPKNGKGRSIKLTARAVEALKRHKAAQNAERLGLGTLWRDHGLVFPGHSGQPMLAYSLTGGPFLRLLKRASLPETTRFHDLRHTCATLLLGRSVHPKIVQELLGHATISITLDTYSHVLPGMGDQAANVMDEAL